MGLILDIVDKVVPRVQERVSKDEELRKVLYEELEKEIAQPLATTQEKEHLKNNISNILTDKVDLDNGYICDKETGQTIGELI